MARNKREGTPTTQDNTDHEQVAQDLRKHDAQAANLQIIDSTWGSHDGEVVLYQRDRVIQEVRFYLGQSAMSMLEAGRRLIQMREHEPHGEWIECLKRIGIEPRVAQKMAQAALKFAPPNAPLTAHLIEAAGNKTKLLELMVLDDGEIAELEKGGTVANLTLDDIECMSTSELRAALREARENEEATGRVLADKNTKIDELANKLNKSKKQVKTLPPDEIAKQIGTEAHNFAFEAEAVIRGQLRPAIEALYQHAEAQGGDPQAFCAGLLAQVQRALIEIRETHNIPEAVSVESKPEWAA